MSLFLQIFLMKHFKNRRADAWNFVLDFDQIYVIDSKTKSISRAKVTVSRRDCYLVVYLCLLLMYMKDLTKHRIFQTIAYKLQC